MGELSAVPGNQTDRDRGAGAPAPEDLVERHGARVTRLASRLLGWSDDVEDVVQEVFLIVLEKGNRFEGRSSFETWLTRVTLNACRKHRWRRSLSRRWKMAWRVATDGNDVAAPDERLDRHDARERVRSEVRRLPAKYREVIVLHYLEGWPASRIAEALGASVDAVHVRLHRGRARLKVSLRSLFERPHDAE